MPTTPDTCRLASCTHSDPGPTITSTFGIDSVPYASAATAWAPVTAKYASAPHSSAAATITGCGAPTTYTSSTPAARAVTTPITTVDGYGLRPPGA